MSCRVVSCHAFSCDYVQRLHAGLLTIFISLGAFHLLQKLSNTESTDDIPHTSMSPHELIQQLTTLGEKMSISELEKCLESLVGEVKDGE